MRHHSIRSYSILFVLPIAVSHACMLKICGEFILLATEFEKPVQAVSNSLAEWQI